jgi:ketosteroid isomerase-like protein
MGATENKQLMQRIFEELSKGNSEPFVASMADDFRWTVTGTTKWSRTYEGKQSVLMELFGPLRARINGSNQNDGASVDCRRRLRRSGSAGKQHHKERSTVQ